MAFRKGAAERRGTPTDLLVVGLGNPGPDYHSEMRKGANLVVIGTSARGTQSTDRYSLKGLAQALDRTGQECR